MKIVQFISSLGSGGAERFVVSLSNELIAMGHEVAIVTMAREGNEPHLFYKRFLSPKCKLYNLGSAHGNKLRMLTTVTNFIKRLHPDVVHTSWGVPYMGILPMFTLGKIPYVQTMHSLADKLIGSRLDFKINNHFYKHHRLHPVAISEICRQSFQKLYGMDVAAVIDNGAAAVEPSPALDDVRAEVASYCCSADTKVFVHPARFHLLKNQRRLIEAFNLLDSRGVDFTLLLMGRGYDCEEGRALQALACDKIKFLGEKANVGDYLLCADAFCLCSDYEGLPISLLEALSAGVTPICTAVGGVADVITDGDNGYLATTLTAEAYADTVGRFIANPLPADRLKKFYYDNYSMRKCAEQYVALYKSLSQ
jgi:glycosyltransferase involved in cell wall biosynthesis